MKICSCMLSYLPIRGGIETGMHSVHSYIAQQTNHTANVITATTGPEPRYEIMDGVEVFRYKRADRWGKWFIPVTYGFLNTQRLLKQIQPDVISIPYILPVGIAAWHAARASSTPIVMNLGGLDIYDPQTSRMPPQILQKWAAYCIQRTDIIVAWSEWVKSRLISHFNARPETIHVIPFGVDTERFRPHLDKQLIRNRHNIRDDQTLLLALQRLDQRKGIDVLLQAFRLVHDQHPETHLLIAGKGPELEKLKMLSRELDLEQCVTFAGFVDEQDKPVYYAAADLFVLHTYYEGLGIVLEEAIASGLPVITTDAAGTRDIIEDGKSGKIVPPGNPQALAQSMIELLDYPELRKEYGNASRQRAETRFSNKVVSRTYLSLFENAVKS